MLSMFTDHPRVAMFATLLLIVDFIFFGVVGLRWVVGVFFVVYAFLRGLKVYISNFGSSGMRTFTPKEVQDFVEDDCIVDNTSSSAVERFIKLSGVINARTLGGIESASGRTVLNKKFYRTAALNDADCKQLEELGIRTVIDLRNARERKRKPNKLPSSVREVNIPFGKDTLIDFFSVFGVLLFARRNIMKIMTSFYVGALRNEFTQGSIRQVLEEFANPEAYPIIVHCAGGKDRTGIMVSLVLSILGVDENVVISEYSLTNMRFDDLFDDFEKDSAFFANLGIPLDEMRNSFIADPEYMRAMFRSMKSRYGTIHEYAERIGIPSKHLTAICHNLLEEDD